MSNGQFVSPALPFLSFRFHDCRRDGETRNFVPSTNERNVLSGRRESSAHVAGPRPEYSIPYITPGPPDDIVAPKSPVVAARAGGRERWIPRFVAASTT